MLFKKTTPESFSILTKPHLPILMSLMFLPSKIL